MARPRFADNRRRSRLLRDESGVTLIMVLVAVVVLGLMAGIAGRTWTSVMQEARERELFWRGDQYRQAIASFYAGATRTRPLKANPQAAQPTQVRANRLGTPPATLEDLVKDPRAAETVRHIRRLYLDPMTGADFEVVKENGRIIGVRSTSELKPFKQDGFPEEYEHFKGAASYRDWEFVYRHQPQAGQTPAAVANPGARLERPTGTP